MMPPGQHKGFNAHFKPVGRGGVSCMPTSRGTSGHHWDASSSAPGRRTAFIGSFSLPPRSGRVRSRWIACLRCPSREVRSSFNFIVSPPRKGHPHHPARGAEWRRPGGGRSSCRLQAGASSASADVTGTPDESGACACGARRRRRRGNSVKNTVERGARQMMEVVANGEQREQPKAPGSSARSNGRGASWADLSHAMPTGAAVTDRSAGAMLTVGGQAIHRFGSRTVGYNPPRHIGVDFRCDS